MLDVLLVEDDADIRAALASAMRDVGHDVTEAGDGEHALRRIASKVFDVVITDMRLPKGDGRSIFQAARHASTSTEVILMTSFGAVHDAVEALKAGAHDYLTKPFDLDELLIRLGRIDDARTLRRDLAAARTQLGAPDPSAILIGASPPMIRLRERLAAVAGSDAPVLVLGETGTGKELVARAIHALSPRRNGPFVAVNCASFPETLLEAELFGHERGAFTGATKRRDGRFRAADRGTLLLDELGEMPAAAQAKLLRVLEEGTIEPLGSHQPVRIDVRIVSSTHRHLRRLIAEGGFREDLYFRLHVVVLEVPPLRDRRGDLPLLVQHFLRKLAGPDPSAEPASLSLAAWSALARYPFPGNVRELAHALEHGVLLSGGKPIDREHLPRDIVGTDGASESTPPIASLSSAAKEFEREYLLRALSQAEGKRVRAAELLGISRKTLWEKLRTHGIADSDLDD